MEIVVNQDIRKFKTKDIGNFSFVEVGWLLVALGLGYGVYLFQKLYLEVPSDDISFAPCVAVAAIPLALGFLKPQGMSCMKYISTVMKEKMLSPQTYIWQSDFVYDMDEFEQTYGEDYKITDERASVINSIGHETTEKKTKEQIKAEKASKKLEIL